MDDPYDCLKGNQPIKCQCCSHIETSQLICTTNQLTGFYMRATLAFNELMAKYDSFEEYNSMT